jgi:hypothetical protein
VDDGRDADDNYFDVLLLLLSVMLMPDIDDSTAAAATDCVPDGTSTPVHRVRLHYNVARLPWQGRPIRCHGLAPAEAQRRHT